MSSLSEDDIKDRSKEYDLACVKFLDISESGYKSAACVSACINLVELTAFGNKGVHPIAHTIIHDALVAMQLVSLTGLDSLRQLRVLNVAFNGLTGIGELKGCDALQTLELHGNKIPDLSTFPELPRLRSLVLADDKGSNPVCASMTVAKMIAALQPLYPRLLLLNREQLAMAKSFATIMLEEVHPSAESVEIPVPEPFFTDMVDLDETFGDAPREEREMPVTNTIASVKAGLQECQKLLFEADTALALADQD